MDACNMNLPIGAAETTQTTEAETTDDQTTASAEVIGTSTDLLHQLLRLLPLKSVTRFKSVSTQWHDLITSPYFTNLRIQNPNTSLPALLLHPTSILTRTQPEKLSSLPEPYLCFVPLDPITNPPPLTSLSFVNPDSPISHTYICNSCNGLLFCCDPTRENYFVVNPTTKTSKKLPPPPNTSLVKGMILAYDPYSVSPVRDHYKVLCVCTTTAVHGFQIEVYSSDSKTWKSCGLAPIFVRFDRGVFMNGAMHWISESGKNSLRFDVDKEIIKPMPMPEFDLGEFQDMKVRYFGKWKGSLYLVYINLSGSHLYIYEMERDYSGWLLKFQVNLDAGLSMYLGILLIYWDDADDDRERPILVVQRYDKIIRCKLIKDDDGYTADHEIIFDIPSINLVDDPEHVGFSRYGWSDAFPYFESLASV